MRPAPVCSRGMSKPRGIVLSACPSSAHTITTGGRGTNRKVGEAGPAQVFSFVAHLFQVELGTMYDIAKLKNINATQCVRSLRIAPFYKIHYPALFCQAD